LTPGGSIGALAGWQATCDELAAPAVLRRTTVLVEPGGRVRLMPPFARVHDREAASFIKPP
jgi:hypothetical protein